MLNSVRGTLVSSQHRIRMSVIDESFGSCIPRDRPSELHGNPTNDAGRPAAMGDPGRRHRLATRADALEAVFVMLIATRQLHAQPLGSQQPRITRSEWWQRRAGRTGIRGRRLTFARDPDPTVIADEFQPIGMFVRHTDTNIPRIGQLDLVGAVHVPDFVMGKVRPRLDAAGAAELGIQRPVHRVVMM